MNATHRIGLLAVGLAIGTLGVAMVSYKSVAAAGQQPKAGSQIQDQIPDDGPDPADANMAPVDEAPAQQQEAQPQADASQADAPQADEQQPSDMQEQPAQRRQSGAVNEAQRQADQYRQQQGAAPIERRAPSNDAGAYPQGNPQYSQNGYPPNGQGQQGYPPNQQQYDQQDSQNYDQNYNPEEDGQDNQPVIEAYTPPPPLPDYDQPEAPYPNYLWTPGYWGWAPAGYYWVPGVWCAAPYQGALWTPGYWFFYGNGYRFHHGFWGLYIGFYGGVNYGYGYFGEGYRGGYWNGPHFYYNRAVTR